MSNIQARSLERKKNFTHIDLQCFKNLEIFLSCYGVIMKHAKHIMNYFLSMKALILSENNPIDQLYAKKLTS